MLSRFILARLGVRRAASHPFAGLLLAACASSAGSPRTNYYWRAVESRAHAQAGCYFVAGGWPLGLANPLLLDSLPGAGEFESELFRVRPAAPFRRASWGLKPGTPMGQLPGAPLERREADAGKPSAPDTVWLRFTRSLGAAGGISDLTHGTFVVHGDTLRGWLREGPWREDARILVTAVRQPCPSRSEGT